MTQATTPANGETPGSPDLDSLAIGQPVEMDGIHVAAATLQEPNVDLLAAVAREIGMDRFEGLLQETLAIEAADGMMLGDGSRRRTPGGVFFFLARKAMTGEQRQRVFPPPLHNLQQSAQTQEAPSLATALGLIRATGNIPPEKKGKATVKTTVIGRVKQIKSMGEFVLAVVTPRGPEPMPKGLPPVPDPGATSIAVFVVRNQWPRVEAALKADPKDALIAEGYLALDAKNQLTGLWALTCTTRNLQKTRYGVK